MKGRNRFAAGLLLAGVFIFPGCGKPPEKSTAYTSIWGDWSSVVPFGWQVITDNDRPGFTNTNFIGPFEPTFLMGAPSLSVRWYAANKAHKLPDGQLEMYASAGDFIKQTLDTVYQPHMKLVRPVTDIEIKKIGKAKYFLVTSPARVPADLKWGTVIDADSGQPYNVRKHAYVVIPAKGGFYVLVYPATEEGYEAYKDKFDDLVYKFQILKDGPGQPAKPAKR